MKNNWLPMCIWLVVMLCLAGGLAFMRLTGGDRQNTIVVYCAHDSIYSGKVLRKFEERTGIKVIAKFDTEATKSLGLIELIKKERNNPRCDVFWNNELLGMLSLQKEGLLLPYKGAGYLRIPQKYKDPGGYWCGFAARMRVYVFNTNLVKPSYKTVEDISAKETAEFAIAKPLYGTTLTHFCCIAEEEGLSNLQEQYRGMLTRGVKVLNGNAAVKDAVAAGGCKAGWTDTDDFFSAKLAGGKVAMLPVKLKSGSTVCIPNTVAIIKGCKNRKLAETLVDFLLSADVEAMLANSPSRQIPLGELLAGTTIPDEVKNLRSAAAQGVPLSEKLLPLRRECIKWLKQCNH